MRTYLWLDDMRNPNLSVWRDQFFPEVDLETDGVGWVLSYSEFVNWIDTHGLPDKIFFDHDLGGDSLDGYSAAKWLGEYCLDRNLDVPEFDIQSSNPVGALNIRLYLNNVKREITNNN
jgi:hypothetical protein